MVQCSGARAGVKGCGGHGEEEDEGEGGPRRGLAGHSPEHIDPMMGAPPLKQMANGAPRQI